MDRTYCTSHVSFTPHIYFQFVSSNKVFLCQYRYEEKILKYYDTQLNLKGSMVLGKDLTAKLVPPNEVEGRVNAFEICSMGERLRIE
jgi:hypothetical protein